MLTFDEASHTYRYAGRVVPNVTRILAGLTDYSAIPADVLARAQAEGTAIHKTVELYLAGDLDEDALPDWLRPRLAAFRSFQADTQFAVAGSERRVYHATYNYAGTLDLAGTLSVGRHRVGAVIDIKRNFTAGPAIGLQLAAYLAAHNDEMGKDPLRLTHRFALQLRDDGGYRLQPFEDRTDFATFLASLTIHNWRTRHGKH